MLEFGTLKKQKYKEPEPLWNQFIVPVSLAGEREI